MATKSTSTRTRKPAKQAAPAVGKSGYAIGIKRTEAEWDALVPTFQAHLEAGGTMQDLRAEYGRSKFIRNALRRAGVQPVGAKRGLDTVSAKAQKKTLINFIVKQRQAGEGWDGLELKTGKNRTELKRILTEANRGDLAVGRVQLRQKATA